MTSTKTANNINIGIFAYNSADTIESMLRGLARQELLQQPNDGCQIAILVLANGCSDETAEISEQTLSSIEFAPQVSWKICEIEQKGKTNAWNEYVHQWSDPDADVLFFMDSDINLSEANTLNLLLRGLITEPKAVVAVDVPVKDISLRRNRTWIDWISLQVSAVRRNKKIPTICGQLYAGVSGELREVWMPIALPVEDGFLKAMTLTDGFRHPDDFERIVVVREAQHLFEAHVRTKKLLAHEEWLVAASTINTFIYAFLWERCKDGTHAGQIIREMNDADPNWVRNLVAKQAEDKSWIVPSAFVFRRFTQLRRHSPLKMLVKLPIACIAFLVDLVVCIRVNRTLKRNQGFGYWRVETDEDNKPTTCKSQLSESIHVKQ